MQCIQSSFKGCRCCGFFRLIGCVLKVVLPNVSPVSVGGIFRGQESERCLQRAPKTHNNHQIPAAKAFREPSSSFSASKWELPGLSNERQIVRGKRGSFAKSQIGMGLGREREKEGQKRPLNLKAAAKRSVPLPLPSNL